MADGSSTTVAQQASGISRVCATCRARILIPSAYLGQSVKCPSCGKVVAPLPIEAVKPLDYHERATGLSTALGWGLSLLVHAMILALFTGVTWFAGGGLGGGEREAGIITDAQGSIGSMDTRFTSQDTPSLDVRSMWTKDTATTDPILDIGPGADDLGREAIIGIELTGDAASGDTDWSAIVVPGAGSGTASFFGLEATGNRFVYVVDQSGSMLQGGRLRAAQNELIRSIRALEEHMEFYVVFYNDRTLVMPASGPVKATAQNKRKYEAWINEVIADGGTRPAEPMKMALELEPDAVWLLSDGEFEASVCSQVRDANRNARVQIHTIAFHSNAGEAQLARIARENRGVYRFVPPATP